MKKKIGITQRVVILKERGESRDVLDQKWYSFSEAMGVMLIPLPNNIKNIDEYITLLGIEGIIFSGGNNVGYNKGLNIKGLTIESNDVAVERDRTEALILELAIKNRIPIVGVCRGFQFINCYLGGTLVSIEDEEHVAAEHQVSFVNKNWQKYYGEHSYFNSYHKWGVRIDDLSPDLKVEGITGSYVEAFSHKCYEIYGIMWHPERNSILRTEDINLFTQLLQI